MADEGAGVPLAPPPEEGAPGVGRGRGGGPVGRGLETIFGVLFSPRATFNAVADRPPLGLAALVVGVVSVLYAIVSLVGAPVAAPMGPGSMVLWVLAVLGVSYISWPVSAALIHLTAELLGGGGRAVGVLALFGLAEAPLFLLVPVQLALNLAGVNLQWLMALAQLGWVLALEVMAVRRCHRLSVGRAVGALFLPALAVMAIAFLAVLGLIALVMPVLRQLPLILPGG